MHTRGRAAGEPPAGPDQPGTDHLPDAADRAAGTVSGMYRFLAKPRWIAFTVLVVVLVVVMVNLGLWQLRRHDERRAANAELRSRQEQPAVALDELVTPETPLSTTEQVLWRTATVRGTYDPAHQVLVRNRSLDGAPGEHVVTPLRLADGSAVLVNRGWVPISTRPGELPLVPEPPDGDVEVTGRVRPTQERGAVGPRDPAEGTLTQVARVDIARIAAQTPYPLFPVYLELTEQSPPAGDSPRLLPEPSLDGGPHLSYAGQWFLFSAFAILGWVLVARKTAKAERQKAAAAARGAASETEPAPSSGLTVPPTRT